MPTYNAKDADLNVAKQAYATAIKRTKDPKVLLSLFEAGMVESNFHNSNKATDHDSLGYLQQRPSQGWPNPTDIPTATNSYLTKAIANLQKNPSYTAGQLAQSVQISAYPGRYAQAVDAANQLLNTVSGAGSDDKKSWIDYFDPNPTLPVPGITSGKALDGIDGALDAIRSIAKSLTDAAKLPEKLMQFFIPSNFVRIASGISGFSFVLLGIYLLGREMRK